MTTKHRADIPVLHEDNHLLVICKPVNVPSQEDISGDPDLLSLLKADLKQRHGKPGNIFLALVHRLDRPVGGVMVLAKTSKAASRLSASIREGSFVKNYLCVVHGRPEPESGTLEHSLLKNRKRNMVRAVPRKTRGSKKAVLDYETLESVSDFSLLKIGLVTGRSHQIRVQLASVGNPLYGDQKYGADKTQSGQQIALWSFRIEFPHPTRGTDLRFQLLPQQIHPWKSFRSLWDSAI
jgi:23S rRNA pseudouridine1911/1915/1917 synthase